MTPGNVTKEYVFLEGAPLAQFVLEASRILMSRSGRARRNSLGVKVYAFRSQEVTRVYATPGENGMASFRKVDLPDGYYKLGWIIFLTILVWGGSSPEQMRFGSRSKNKRRKFRSLLQEERKGVNVYLFSERYLSWPV
jgi:hypothetical protein